MEVDVVVEEELADQELGAGVHLLPQEGDVRLRLAASGWISGKTTRRTRSVGERSSRVDGTKAAELIQAAGGATKSESPRGGSPRRASTFSDPRRGEAGEDRLEALEGLADAARWVTVSIP